MGIEAIAKNLPNLTSLDLSTTSTDTGWNNLGKAAAGTIAKGFGKLIKLSIGICRLMQGYNESIGDEDVALIAAGLPRLEELNIENCGVTDRGAEAIAKHLPNLQELNLGTTSGNNRKEC